MLIIQEEKLKEEETRKFLDNSFNMGEIKTIGTDIDKIMPPVSRFGGGGRDKKKLNVLNRLKAYYEKYSGIGVRSSFVDKDDELDIDSSMVAEDKGEYRL